MTDTYRVLVAKLDQGSDQVDEIVHGLEEEGYSVVQTEIEEFETLDNPVMDWYDTFIVSMDNAHDVRYDDGLMQDKHIILEGVTPLRQPEHIDESYNTAKRAGNVIQAVRREEWQQYDGVGDEIASLLEERRPTETSPEAVEKELEEAYPNVGPMLGGRISLS